MRWKSAQKKSKLKRRVRLASLMLALIIALLLVGQFIKVGKNLFSPLQDSGRRYTWDSNFNLNLVLLTKPLSVLSYNPIDKKITILEIPDDTYLLVPDGHGSWRAGAIYKLGGAKLLTNSISNFLSLPIDGFIQVGDNKTGEEVVDSLRKNPFQAVSMQTNLSPIESIKFILGARGVRFDKISTFNLQDLGLLSDSQLADGSNILVGDSSKIDALVLDHFTDNKLVEEAATIAVFNSTGMPGLANKTAELITHLGGNVIIQTNLDSTSGETVLGANSKYPYTTKRLKQIFSPSGKIDKAAPDFSRAQISLILGQK